MNAFCFCPFRPFPTFVRPSNVGIISTTCHSVTPPYSKASKPSPSSSSRNKRPRTSRKSSSPSTASNSSSPSGFGSTNAETSKQSKTRGTNNPYTYDDDDFGLDDSDDPDDFITKRPSKNKKEQSTQPLTARKEQLRKLDANGISMEHRLREEILHPLRKPKLTLFGTLAFSATLGFFFACARLVTDNDGLLQVSTNVAIDITAVTLFGYLTRREFEFGRRSLNSLAGIPQPRDLRIILNNYQPKSNNIVAKWWRRRRNNSAGSSNENDNDSASQLIGELLKKADAILIVAGGRSDVLKYIERCEKEAEYNVNTTDISSYGKVHPALIAFATDGGFPGGMGVEAATAVATTGVEGKTDWVAWLGEAVPPRRNVALFRIEGEEGARETASECVVAVDDPAVLPLPEEARRLTVVEV